ncbi:Peptidase family C25 [Arachidicoccus rhizosphaerae]|uniref:Peptidase family C25 n=1 Tax=Arachidicoccus rhizosphaerae TaxID=551991 RepID=A0A1H3W1K0_9BACT|nr:C25 family cysteine peptidase [Arachidicoccus rhizosphaerae]SDZ80284.1 Peptidase family C25 [Arachidicoccus rhizosphaerae]
MTKRNLHIGTLLLLVLGLLFTTGKVTAQTYNNEWIVNGQTYYKFKIATDGLYRISGTTLSSVGIASAVGSSLQLWRNGEQVPIYTSNTGTLGTNDYIEFWGEHNDGSVDKALFKNASDQLNKAESFEGDSSSYFLTINTNSSQNLRYTKATNDVAGLGSSLTAEPYFYYTIQKDLGSTFNRGPATAYGSDYVYMSDYKAKCFGTIIKGTKSTSASFTNLYGYSGGTGIISSGMAGASTLGSNRTITVKGSDGATVTQSLGNFEGKVISAGGAKVSSSYTVTVTNGSSNANDQVNVSFVSLYYPRTFNFGGASSFAFNLSASSKARLLNITNFSAGGSTPVLLDITHGLRYEGVVNGSTYQFVLPAMDSSHLALVGQSATSYTSISAADITSRLFPNLTVSDQQGDYLIISNKALYGRGDYVSQYAAYRKSSTGGGYNVHIYNIDDLEDMFAFGVHSSPLSIKNFLRYARNTFAAKPKFAFLIGRGLTFDNMQGANASNSEYQDQNLVPTFGWPASDIMLAADNSEPVAAVPIGRLSAVKPDEIKNYLEKVKVYEAAQQSTDHTIANNAWKKNVVFISGGSTSSENNLFTSYLNDYKTILNDSLFGAQSYYLSKITSDQVSSGQALELKQLVGKGLGIISYFGHGASTTIGYSELSDPSAFENNGRFPIIFTSGCDVGDCFSFMTGRTTTINNITERYMFGADKGSIGFVAETYLGVTSFLQTYNLVLYKDLAHDYYGQPISVVMQKCQSAMITPERLKISDTITNYAHAEQTNYYGDPAISLYNFNKPDFAVEDDGVIAPSSVSISSGKFNLKAYLYNIGRAIGDSVNITVVHKFPDGSQENLFDKKIKSIHYIDSLSLDVTIDANKSVGNNQFVITIDNDNTYDELNESNNSVSKNVNIYANGITPVYPYNYSIIHNATAPLVGSTSDALASSATYIMELDTSKLFNSPFLVTKSIKSVGGAISFDPGITYKDSVVYYWRISPAIIDGEDYKWAYSSFQYITDDGTQNDGVGQSHYFQHLQSTLESIQLDSLNREWAFTDRNVEFVIGQAVIGSGISTGYSNFKIIVDKDPVSSYYCTKLNSSLMFNVFDPLSFKPYINQNVPSVIESGEIGGFMGATSACKTGAYSYDTDPVGHPNTNKSNFQFSYQTEADRAKIVDFFNWIPDGTYVVMRLFVKEPFNNVPLIDAWKNDAGGNANLYNTLLAQGLTSLDQFTQPQGGIFVFRKNNKLFTPIQALTGDVNGQLLLTESLTGKDSIGYITSPKFGPAKDWKSIQWNGLSKDLIKTDHTSLEVWGVTSSGANMLLKTLNSDEQNSDISSIDASTYPYLQLKLRNADSIYYTPFQLRYWHILYTPVSEGALAGNIALESKDTIDLGQDLTFGIAFKNVSDQIYSDSIKANVTLRDKDNQLFTIPIQMLKPIQVGDTAMVYVTIPGDTTEYNAAHPNDRMPIGTMNLGGAVTLGLDINPSLSPLEYTHDNNFLYKSIYIRTEEHNTQLDVTFDGVHILDNDIVAAKPVVAIRVSDDSKYLLLNDTAVAKISLVYPDGSIKNFGYNSDTLTFSPATDSTKNEALIDFRPYLTQDGTYELIIKGQGKTGNATTATDYSVNFQVYNKPMISDMFNYPNPFTTSTAFVFTITGSQVPQNIRIQILTVTGKIVKEITKEELGPLHVGRNITDYKWDGTDNYGQKLANGVYIYRVITNQDGKKLDHFTIKDTNGNEINTGKYFNKGYGKMYLMR